MAMIWVYAGGEPERTIVDTGYCTGVLEWKRASALDAGSPGMAKF
jgi:hypothetical protein